MSNPFYTKTGNPQSQSRGLSSQMRNEFALVEQGFDAVAPINSPAFTGTPTAPTPTAGTSNTAIATTAFVMAAALDANIPGQTGNAGKFLGTDGTNASWAAPLPTQTGHSGEFLTTNGTVSSWGNVPSSLPTQTGHSGEFLTTNGTVSSWGIPTKSTVGLSNVDNTSDTNKPVSTATQTALNAKQDTLVSNSNIKTINSASLLGPGNVDLLTTDVGHNNVGSFCFARSAGLSANPGAAVAGSDLNAAGIDASGSSYATTTIYGASTLSGTWRILGYANFGNNNVSLFQRIA